MKFLLIILLVVLSFSYSAIDNIFQENKETNTFSIHSFGILSYGMHTNTFHIRKAYLKFIYTKKNIQFFVTEKFYKDTHNPSINYGFILNNAALFDYGFNLFFLKSFFFSMRGASAYPKNRETFLLIPHYFNQDNPGEFDTNNYYLKEQKFAPGIRIGYESKNILFAYSQGDFRHLIPMSMIIKFSLNNFYIRGLIYSINDNPLIYKDDLYTQTFQLSSLYKIQLDKFQFGILIEDTYIFKSSNNIFRAEQYVSAYNVTFGLREILNNSNFLMEISIQKEIENIVSIGIFANTDNKIYIAALIDF